MLKGKCVVVGVCGGIAAYKSCTLVSMLKKLGAEVFVIMTDAAKEFVGELTFRTLSQNPVYDNMFNRPERWEVEHVELAKKADLIIVAPASANTIAKFAAGISDNPLTATVLATRAPVLLAPAMNTGMLENEITQRNIKALEEYGFLTVYGKDGILACGDMGKGRMAEAEEIVEAAIDAIAFEADLEGKTVMVSAGATREAIDPVRFITNHSSGKMGYAVALAAKRRGASVILVSGKTALKPIENIENVFVESADEMYDAIIERAKGCDIIVMAAAVADFKPKEVSDNKIKKSGKEEMSIELVRNRDILSSLGEEKKDGQVLVGFCMETKQLIESAKDKLKKKNCDFIVANNLFDKGAGFGVDTNTVTVLFADGEALALDNMPKERLAHIILDEAIKKRAL